MVLDHSGDRRHVYHTNTCGIAEADICHLCEELVSSLVTPSHCTCCGNRQIDVSHLLDALSNACYRNCVNIVLEYWVSVI